MSASYSTLLLDLNGWDLCLDASRNIAVAAPPYAVAQDVACAIRTFLGDCYYDQTIGVRYFTKILGQTPPVTTFKAYLRDAALSVPTVAAATVTLQSPKNRNVTGFVEFTDENGTTQQVAI